jgi:multiple sugar transport system ATP-binding protein
MVKEPKVFMFDEPLSNLDAALRGRMRQEIASLHRRIRATMIFVTHDQTEAMTLADRIVVMNQQRIEQIGSPLEIYRNPATLFVAGFIGSPAMNILAVQSEAAAATVVTLRDGTKIDAPAPAAGCAVAHIGVRPESLSLVAPTQGQVQGTVEFIEHLGDRSHVLVTLSGGEHVTALCGSEPNVTVGERVGVRFALGQMHLFDAKGVNCGRARA